MTTTPQQPPRRYAVIDIGSNAVRLNMGIVTEEGQFISETFTRIPLLLGRSTFSSSSKNAARINKPTQKKLAQALCGMRLLIKSMSPRAWRAVATAALRCASNRDEVLQMLRADAGVAVKVLTGAQEAAVIGRFVAAQFPKQRAILNIDVGGGSSDAALIINNKSGGKVVAAETFAIGTVRQNGGSEDEKQRLQTWLATHSKHKNLLVCASGGNVRRLVGDGETLTPRALQQWQRQTKTHTPHQLATRHDMPLDHARRLNTTISIYQQILTTTNRPLHPISGGLAEAVLRDLATR